MRCETHVIDIGRRLSGNRHRMRPEAEVIHSVVTLGHCEEGFPVASLHPHDKNILAAQLDGSGIERAVDSKPLKEPRIRRRIQVIAPKQRSVPRRDDRIGIPCPNAVG